MNDIRSTYLVHWTGRSFASLDENKRMHAYINRLVSLYNNGLYLQPFHNADIIRGFGNRDLPLPLIPSVCFTELRLHESSAFALEYGKLGIGFHREYLLKYGANPVFYLQSANQGIVNTNVTQIYRFVPEIARGPVDVILGYFKPMSEPDSKQLSFYEEHEWRIVQAPGGFGLPPEFQWISTGEGKKFMTFHFDEKEVELLVFPNSAIRAKALEDKQLSEIFSRHTPMMLDYDACSDL